MSDIAIRVNGLSKQYRIGGKQKAGMTLRDTLSNTLTAPFRRGGQLLRGQAYGASGASEAFWALKEVSFEVKRGEVIGIIGRNGAGKSTLLMILSRITEPTEGRAEVYGRVGALLEVGTGFHPELSGRENIYLNAAILGMKRAEIDRKFDEIVAFAEVEKFIDTPVKHYSSGMGLRLGFAVAAHLEPEILIVDEVLAVGDAAFQKKCLGKMSDVASEGRTVLFVSHNMAAVAQLCQRGIWIEAGMVKQTALVQTVIESYLSLDSVSISERRWTYPGNAPGDDNVRLLAGRVIQNGHTTAIVDINQPCEIEMDFAVLRPVNNLISGLHIYDVEGLCLFAHADWRPNQYTPGHYRRRVSLPAQVFAEGQMHAMLQLVFYEPNLPSVNERNALVFDTIDSDHPLTVRGHYKGHWPGVVRLGLQWTDAEPLPLQP